MEGYANHTMLEDSIFVKKGMTKGKLYGLPYGYPALIEGDGWVKGEIYDVDEVTLQKMDTLEAYYGQENDLFQRLKANVLIDGGIDAKAFIYYYSNRVEAQNAGEEILEGDWRNHVKSMIGRC